MKAMMIASLILISVALAGATRAEENVYGDNALAQDRAQTVYDSLSELGVQRVLVFYQNSPRMEVYANASLGEGLSTNEQNGRDLVSALVDLMEYDMPGLESYEIELWSSDELAVRGKKEVGLLKVEFLK